MTNISSTNEHQNFLKFLALSSSIKNILIETNKNALSSFMESTTRQLNDEKTDTSNFNTSKLSLEIEKNISKYSEEHLKEEKEKLLESLAGKLIPKLQNFSYDDESMEAIWAVSDRILEDTSIYILGEVLQKIYLSHNDYPNILCGICKLLVSFDLDEVTPWGPTLLIGLLNHKNETVKEYSVILLDNWKDTSLIPVLRNLDCRAPWLQAYIQDVLLSMEK